MDKGIHFFNILGRDVMAGIEIPDTAAEARGEFGGIEVRNRADAAFTREDVAPGFLHSEAHRRYHAQPGDDNASFFRHGLFLTRCKK